MFHSEMVQVIKILKDDIEPFILQSQYHGCWWPGNPRNLGISSLGIDQIHLEYSGSPALDELNVEMLRLYQNGNLIQNTVAK